MGAVRVCMCAHVLLTHTVSLGIVHLSMQLHWREFMDSYVHSYMDKRMWKWMCSWRGKLCEWLCGFWHAFLGHLCVSHNEVSAFMHATTLILKPWSCCCRYYSFCFEGGSTKALRIEVIGAGVWNGVYLRLFCLYVDLSVPVCECRLCACVCVFTLMLMDMWACMHFFFFWCTLFCMHACVTIWICIW